MTDRQSTSYGRGAAAARQREFASLYRLVLVVEAVLGLFVLFAPRLANRALALPRDADYRLWGAMLLFSVLLQLPGLASPIHARVTVIAGILGRGLLILVYLLLLLWLPALATIVATGALSVLFTRLIYAEIDSKP